MSELMKIAAFVRKAIKLEEIINRAGDNNAQAFVTERVILLSDADYENFKQNGLMQDCEFFFDSKESMWFDPEKSCWHCLLVKGGDQYRWSARGKRGLLLCPLCCLCAGLR